MGNWVRKTIGELCDLGGGVVKTGPFGSQLHQSDYSEEGTPVIMPADIIEGGISEGRIVRVSEGHVDRLAKHKLAIGDIVYGRRGDIGRQALIRENNVGWLCGTGCLRVTLGDSEVIPEYLHLYLKMPEVIGWIQNQAIGATMPNLNTQILRRVPVFFPESKAEQRKIVSWVFAYDDLIENNKCRIALLEKMAEEIYREWFVRFRFPGYQTAKFEKGIPKGWNIRSLSSLTDVNSRSLKRNEQLEKIEYVDIGSVTTNKLGDTTTYDIKDAPGRAKRRVKHGDIIWSSVRPANRAYCLILNPQDNLVVSTGFAVISVKESEFFPFVYQAVTTNGFVDQITAVAKGAAYPATSFDDFEKSSVLYPTDDLVKEYFEICEPFYEEKYLLEKQSENLKKIKDMLLPRLISGKLSVADLDIQFPPSMLDDKAA